MSTTTRTAPPPGGIPAGAGPRSPRLFITALAVIAAGLALGLLTLYGQKWLHGAWLAAVNSGAVWLLPAFAAGACMRTNTAAALAATAPVVVLTAIAYALINWAFLHS